MDPVSIPALDAHVTEYASAQGLQMAPMAGALRGKVVIVDTVAKTLHPLQRGLSAAQAAQVPEDVGIVVWIATDYVHEGDLVPGVEVMSTGVPARYDLVPLTTTVAIRLPVYRSVWNVTVIDWLAKQVRYRNTFQGGNPPSVAVNFKSDMFTGRLSVYQGNDEQPGVEILRGMEGGIELSSGERITGLAGTPPWEETLRWLAEVTKRTG
jgi:hypothetical protein